MKKVLCIALCLMFIMSNITTAFALENDYENSWAKNEIEYMKNRGIVSGYPNGSFKPSNNMSKAEFYKVINKIMGFTQKSEINFNDVVTENWYYNDVAKGVAAGYIIPAESLEAGKNINRGEVARIIGIVFSIEGNKQEANNFADSNTIPEQLKAAIGGLKKSGYINGYPDGSFKVNAEITRAEVVKMLCNITGEIINEKSTVKSNAEKNLVVNIAGVTLKDIEVGGNLYLTEGIGEGDVLLDNVKVKNSTIVNGGGANSVNIKNSELKSLLLDKKQNLLNVVLSNTKIETAKNANQARLQLSQGSSIKNLELKSKAELVLEKNALIDRLIMTGADISINAQGSVNYLKSDSKFKVNGEQANANTEYKIVDGKLMLLNPTASTGSTGGTTPTPNPVVSKTDLVKAIALAEGKNKNDYTSDSWTPFATALQTAKVINSKTNATQAEVNAALNNLTAAMTALVKKVVGTDPSIIAKYRKVSPSLPIAHISIQVQNLGEAAKFDVVYNLADNEDGTPNLGTTPIVGIDDETIGIIYYPDGKYSTVTIRIYNSNNNLLHTFKEITPVLIDEPAPEIDKTKLVSAIAIAKTKVADDYTTESWTLFTGALQAAEVVKGDENATQSEVNNATTNLNTAMTNLKLKSVGPAPTIVASFYPSYIPTFGDIGIDEITNLPEAAKFIVEYHLSPNDDGSENIKYTGIVAITERTKHLVFYSPSTTNHNTIKIMIYNSNDVLIYTFEAVVPNIPR